MHMVKRILFVSGSFHGHVNTLLPLALAANAAGHDVAFATGPDLAPEPEARGISTWTVGATHATLTEGGTPASWLAYFESAAAKRLPQLIARTRTWRPDLVIHEETELAGAVVAALAGVSGVVHGLSVMPSARLRTLFVEAAQRLSDGTGAQLDMAHHLAAARYLDVCPPPLQPSQERAWQQVMPIRPAMGSARAGEALPATLAALPFAETVHLTLGTVFHDRRTVLGSAIEVLRELPCNLVVATGPGSDPALLGPQPPHVLLTPYIAHELLLPRCRLVVSQGGAGVLFGGLAHGLPQLVLPQGADQFDNAHACVRAEAGLALVGDEFTTDNLRHAVLRLLEEESFTLRAQAVAQSIRAMPDASQVLRDLTAVSS
jgi:UDP:flavonoid glycosyltransferase YjiC (YdhE family)